MPKISKERLERYRRLADKDLFDSNDEKIHAFYKRALEEGLTLVNSSINLNGMFLAPYRNELTDVDIVLVGVPMDIGVPNPRPGTRLGPQALRSWSLNKDPVHYITKTLPFELCSIIDWGDVAFKEDIYNLNANVGELLEIYSKFKDADVVPFSVGGEHTITYPILKALGCDEPLGLIHLDSHGDTCVNFGGTRVSDASLLQLATTEGVIDPERTIQIGLRGRGLTRCDFSFDSGMRVVLVEEFQKKGAVAIAEEARKIVGSGPCYLTIDTDVFDCSEMPGTTLPEPFGLTGREVRDFLRDLRGLDLVGADIVELCPPFDPTLQSVFLATGIAFEMLCLLAEARVQRTGRKRKTHWKK